MIQQITNQLYVCGANYTSYELKSRGITRVINVGGKFNKRADVHIHLNDGPNKVQSYADVMRFMESWYDKKYKILVHCRQGISRSPFILAVFISEKSCISLDDAISMITLKNPRTDINIEMLQNFVSENMQNTIFQKHDRY